MTEPAPSRSERAAHRGTLDSYRTVVDVTPRAKRPVYGTRFLGRCSCGWSVAHVDYTNARRAWRRHLDESERLERGSAFRRLTPAPPRT